MARWGTGPGPIGVKQVGFDRGGNVILADMRKHFASRDVDFVIDLLAEGSSSRKQALKQMARKQGIHALLDDARLPEKLQDPSVVGAPTQALLLYVLTRHTLLDAGVDDRRLSEYVGALLLEFGVRDRAHRIAPNDDEVYRYVADIVAHIATEHGKRGFQLRAHLGNFTLWLAGVFPDYVTARVHRKGAPDLRYYEEVGAHGFRLASDHQLARAYDLVSVYRKASDSFGRLRVALNRLSDRVFFPNNTAPDRLLRQVRDGFLDLA